MERKPRFECPSITLTLSPLLRQTRKALWITFGVALILHLSLTQWRGFAQQQRSVKPLTTQFIKRQPRLSKPLELKKRPQPRQRTMQRKVVSVKAEMQRDQRGSRFEATQVLRGLARPSVDIGRTAAFGSVQIEPRSIAGLVEGTKEIEQKIDMSLELLDTDALNTGKHHAMVIQDPNDKRNIRGFFQLAVVCSPSLRDYTNQSYGLGVVLAVLVDAMNRYTNIKTRLAGTYNLDSRELFKTPFIMITASGHRSFELSRSETESLGKYLTSGGFSFVDNDDSVGGPVGLSLYRLIKQAVESTDRKYGTDWTFERLPNDHPIYHCFFDFDGMPATLACRPMYRFHRELIPHMDYLEGIHLDGRLVSVVSMEDFTSTWTMDIQNKVRQTQFGVNLIVFALTQEGSITHQLMDSIK